MYNIAYNWVFGKLPMHESQRRRPLTHELFDHQLYELFSNDSALFERNHSSQSEFHSPPSEFHTLVLTPNEESYTPFINQRMPTPPQHCSLDLDSSLSHYGNPLHSSIFNPVLLDEQDDKIYSHGYGSNVNSSTLMKSHFIHNTLQQNSRVLRNKPSLESTSTMNTKQNDNTLQRHFQPIDVPVPKNRESILSQSILLKNKPLEDKVDDSNVVLNCNTTAGT
jgi:hypothetical protein